jgi:hypothetical protein
MNLRRIGRMAAALGAAAALAGAQVMVQAVTATPASAAVSGFVIVQAQSVQDSARVKEVTVFCPSGKRVIGTGFHLLGAQGDVILDGLVPSTSSVKVSATEDQDGTNATWKITAIAVCATAPAGLQIVTASSASNFESSKTVTAKCPAGKQLLGTGAELPRGFGQISISNLVVSSNSTGAIGGVFAVGTADQDGFSNSWPITAHAICANPLPGLEIKSAQSAFDSATSKIASANCSAGKVATGLGWGKGGLGQVHVNFAGQGETGITIVANEDDDGFANNWQLTPVVICATR